MVGGKASHPIALLTAVVRRLSGARASGGGSIARPIPIFSATSPPGPRDGEGSSEGAAAASASASASSPMTGASASVRGGSTNGAILDGGSVGASTLSPARCSQSELKSAEAWGRRSSLYAATALLCS
eukprot:6741491-Prymnesium_polylepis.1